MSESTMGGYTGRSETAQIPVAVDNSYILTAAQARAAGLTAAQMRAAGLTVASDE